MKITDRKMFVIRAISAAIVFSGLSVAAAGMFWSMHWVAGWLTDDPGYRVMVTIWMIVILFGALLFAADAEKKDAKGGGK